MYQATEAYCDLSPSSQIQGGTLVDTCTKSIFVSVFGRYRSRRIPALTSETVQTTTASALAIDRFPQTCQVDLSELLLSILPRLSGAQQRDFLILVR
jgi:hypothetical protein